jgi:hypothetical protein
MLDNLHGFFVEVESFAISLIFFSILGIVASLTNFISRCRALSCYFIAAISASWLELICIGGPDPGLLDNPFVRSCSLVLASSMVMPSS